MNEAGLEIDFWNVGQADSTTITLPCGSLVVIDVGRRGSPLVEWLSEGHRAHIPIKAIVITHNDADHAGSLPMIVKKCAPRIEGIWMLLDRPKNDPRFQRIFHAAYAGEAEGHYQIRRVEVGQEIWSDSDRQTTLKIIHPSASENWLATNPNDSSGVIVLESRGRPLISWPGDLRLGPTARLHKDAPPELLVGPHHGGPSDYPSKAVRRKMSDQQKSRAAQDFIDAANALKPKINFLSVGTWNEHDHPRPGYLKLMAGLGSKVICSQLTACCDRQRVLAERHVFEGAGALGLRTPKRGVSCRGAMRIYFKDGVIFEDEFSSRHRERVESLRHPRCLVRQTT